MGGQKLVKLIFFLLLTWNFTIAQQNDAGSRSEFDKLLKVGQQEIDRGEYSLALEHLKKAETMIDKVQSKQAICALKSYIGNAYGFLSNYGEALGYYQQALKLAREMESNENIALILNNIGWLYAIDNDTTTALENFEDAYEIAKKYNIGGYTKSRIAVNIAGIYNKQGEFNKSQQYLLEVKDTETTEEVKQTWKVNYAESLLLSGQVNEAEKIAKSLLEGAHVQCYTCITTLLVNIYENQGKKDLAIFYARKGVDQTSSFADKIDLYNHLSRIYASAEDCTMAFKYKDSVVIAKDSMSARVNRGLYEANKVSMKVQEYQSELKVSKERQSAERILFIVASVFTLVLFYFIYRSLKNRITKQKQEKIIADNEKKIYELELDSLKNNVAEKNRKLSAKALYLSGRNELIEEVIDALSNITDIKRNKKVLEYMGTLKGYVKSDAEWDEFITYFEQANPNFLRMLSAKHPQLNNADIRFICYVLMNLDIREISTIFNITINAATKRKRRIKEKIGIDREDSLYEYLTKLSV